MSRTVIKIENLSKYYRLGEISTGTISNDLNRWWQMNMLGKEDPYAQIGQLNDKAVEAKKGEHIYALKDINLEICEGDVLGVIGKNGAGKSSLLKILSRITKPSNGTVKLKGRLASLLEVGTGFHPEMTGRENIYMNGTIMGMRKWEIDKKLDEIVEFSGIAKYLDTPTKRYSSGMTVRLGFAVAAHLEPEILIVDEVLAVGDAEFQKKAIGKMKQVSTEKGRTILFVSHNMTAVEMLCNKGAILENGHLVNYGEIGNVIQSYFEKMEAIPSHVEFSLQDAPGNNFGKLLSASIKNKSGEVANSIPIDEPVCIEIAYQDNQAIARNTAIIHVKDSYGNTLFASNEFNSIAWEQKASNQITVATCFIPPNLLAEGTYFVLIALGHYNPNMLHSRNENILSFKVVETYSGKTVRKHTTGNWPGLIRPFLNWDIYSQNHEADK
ncbi:MAG: ABC transporter ATP-binding protein [Cytophaga sp.]|uniref:ABC transporter ATP-binding protein n=1 Tax=Cytophaga sp. TaxID=29535 RepID=UPI003F7EDB01